VLHSQQVQAIGSRCVVNRPGLIVRAVLLLVGLSAYLISPDDVVWHFIKVAPHAREWEHALFGLAAASLGFALLLKVRDSAQPEDQDSPRPSHIRSMVASLLQAIGIGSLLPLPGFLVLVLGDVAASLLLDGRHSTAEVPRVEPDSRRADRGLQAFRRTGALATHLGLCFAFLSMVVFSVVLIDRVADVLFAITALVSVVSPPSRTGALRPDW
jgi:hypothetical protein